MSEISEEVDFWLKRGDIVEVKQKFTDWVYDDLVELDNLVDMSYANEYLLNKNDLTTDFLEELSDEILDYTDSVSYQFSNCELEYINVVCDCACRRIDNLVRIIRIQKHF